MAKIGRSLQHNTVILVGIIVVGLSLRLYGIDFGLPYPYDPDEPDHVRRALLILGKRDLNPHWFGHPGTTVIYLSSALYALIFLVGLMGVKFKNVDDIVTLFFQDPTVFYLSSRVALALFGVATILLTYSLGSKIFDKPIGLMAAAFLAISPIHVYHSKLIRPDILMTFLIVLVAWLCLRVIRKGGWLDYTLAGFFLGVAVATKYPAVLAVLFIFVAYLSKGWRQNFTKLVASAAASIVGAFVSSPFLFLDFRTALGDVLKEARSSHLSHTGEGLVKDLGWYVQDPLLSNLTIIGLALVVFGCFLCITSKEKEKWLLLVFPVSYLLFISSLSLRWDRWVIPVLPFLYLLAAQALSWIIARLRQVSNRQLAYLGAVAIFLLMAVPLLTKSVVNGRELSGTDTRTLAREWILEHIPEGGRVLIEYYVPHLPTEQYAYFVVNKEGKLVEVSTADNRYASFRPPFSKIGEIQDTIAVRERQIEYMVLSDFYDRYLKEGDSQPNYTQAVANYEALMDVGNKLAEFNRVPGKNTGPRIQIYQFAWLKE